MMYHFVYVKHNHQETKLAACIPITVPARTARRMVAKSLNRNPRSIEILAYGRPINVPPADNYSKCPVCGYFAFDGLQCFDCGYTTGAKAGAP